MPELARTHPRSKASLLQDALIYYYDDDDDADAADDADDCGELHTPRNLPC